MAAKINWSEVYAAAADGLPEGARIAARYAPSMSVIDGRLYKTCYGCKRQLLANTQHFRKNLTKTFGISDYCKPCQGDYEAAFRSPASVRQNLIRSREYHREKRRLARIAREMRESTKTGCGGV